MSSYTEPRSVFLGFTIDTNRINARQADSDMNQFVAAIGVRVMTAPEAVALVRGKIQERDERARRLSREDGTPLPDWVGKD